MIVVRNLVKQYGTLRAVDGMSFEIQPGEVLGLVRPNGAGKTTTLRCLSGIIAPTADTAEATPPDPRVSIAIEIFLLIRRRRGQRRELRNSKNGEERNGDERNKHQERGQGAVGRAQL